MRIPTQFNSTLLELMRDVVERGKGPGAYTLAELRQSGCARTRPGLEFF